MQDLRKVGSLGDKIEDSIIVDIVLIRIISCYTSLFCGITQLEQILHK